MRRVIQIVVFIIFSFGIISSCKDTNSNEVDFSKKPIVTVFGKTLYQSDIKGLFPYGISSQDSIKILNSYVKQWTEEQLIYNNALKNLSSDDEIEKLEEAYKRTLTINSYLSQLLEERLNESVDDNELIAFFEKNKEHFPLNENIIKGLYLKIPKESSQLQNFRKWYKEDSEEAINNIEKNYLQNTVEYDNFYSYWVSFDDVMENTPQNITDRAHFLKNNKTLETSDSSFVYLLNIKDFKLIGEEVPIEYIKERLKEAYKEEQRKEFIEQLNKDLLEKATTEGELHYYDVK